MSNDEGSKQYTEIPICGKHVVVFFHGDDCFVCKQAGRASLEELLQAQYEILEGLRLSVQWEISPIIMRKIAEVCEQSRAALAGKSGEVGNGE